MFALLAPLVCGAQSNAQSDNIGSPKFTTGVVRYTVLATSKTVRTGRRPLSIKVSLSVYDGGHKSRE